MTYAWCICKYVFAIVWYWHFPSGEVRSGGICAKGEKLAICDNGGDRKGRGWKIIYPSIGKYLWIPSQAGLLLYGGFDNTLAALGDCWRIDLASHPPTWIRCLLIIIWQFWLFCCHHLLKVPSLRKGSKTMACCCRAWPKPGLFIYITFTSVAGSACYSFWLFIKPRSTISYLNTFRWWWWAASPTTSLPRSMSRSSMLKRFFLLCLCHQYFWNVFKVPTFAIHSLPRCCI